MSSLTIAGSAYDVLEWPAPTVEPAIQWVEGADRYWYGADRGAAQDTYEAKVTFYDSEANINALQTTLGNNREGLTLSGFTVPLFAPNVDHTGSISATVVSFGARKQMGFVPPSSGMYGLDVKFQALTPTLLGTTPSLASLRLQENFDADHSWDIAKGFTYGKAAVYADRRADAGVFSASYMQTTAELQAILAYLMTTARANTIALPTHAGVVYPFGIGRGTYPLNAKVKEFSIARQSVAFWSLKIKWVENG